MKTPILSGLAAAIALAVCNCGAAPKSADQVNIDHCLVSLIDEIDVPGQEAGVLEILEVQEGSEVKAGDEIGHIDFRQAERKRDAAAFEKAKAEEEFQNDVDIRYAEAAHTFALWDYQAAKIANGRLKGTVSRADVGQKNLAAKKAKLQIEQAERDRILAGLTSQVKAAEMDLAENDIERRRIRSKIDGVVVEVLKHPGEWIALGDTVLKVVGMKHLRVEAFLNAAEHSPDEIDNQPITVRAALPGGEIRFDGKVVFIHPSVQSGQFKVWAEIKNERSDSGQWLLRPGTEVEMTIKHGRPTVD